MKGEGVGLESGPSARGRRPYRWSLLQIDTLVPTTATAIFPVAKLLIVDRTAQLYQCEQAVSGWKLGAQS